MIQSVSPAVSTIYEIDPLTGQQLRSFVAPGATTFATGLAFQDGVLYLSKSGIMYQIDVDTQDIIGTIPLPTGNIDGMAVIGAFAYVLNSSYDAIIEINIATQQVVRTLNLGTINNGDPNSVSLVTSLGEAPDGVNLAVRSDGNVLIVDPATGLIVNTLANLGVNNGLAGANGELFLTLSSSNSSTALISAFDQDGLRRRVLGAPAIGNLGGYAADVVTATEHRVRVYTEQTISNLDFGALPTTGQISGVQFVDTNGNGVQDVGELPLAGVTVFVDSNGNDWPDAGEPFATSAADGTYTILNVPTGHAFVRTLAPSDYRRSSGDPASDRLFSVTLVSNAASSTGYYAQINELDRLTGATIYFRQTTIPINTQVSAAFDGRRLIMVDNTTDKLSEVALDGTLLDQVSLPGVTAAVYSSGPAVINGVIYMLINGGGYFDTLIRYNPDTNQFYGAVSLTQSSSLSPTQVTPGFQATLSESTDGQSLIAAIGDDRVLVIDPLTARVTQVVTPENSNGIDFASTAVGGELFIQTSGYPSLNVYDSQFNLLRQLTNSFAYGLAGGQYVFDNLLPGDHVVRIVMQPDERSIAIAPNITRLFLLNVAAGVGIIREVDPLSGDVLRSFPVPGTVTNSAGLALSSDTLYYSAVGKLWLLDPDTGQVRKSVGLPGSGSYQGAAFVNNHVFILDANSDTILKHDSRPGELLSTFDINSINSSGYDLRGGLGESFDGTKLHTRTNNEFLEINPDTGVIETNISLSGGGYGTGFRNGLSSADGEMYFANGTTSIGVYGPNPLAARNFTTGYTAFGIGVANSTATEFRIRLNGGQNFTTFDFALQAANAPTDILLSNTSINENVSTSAADFFFNLSVVDESLADSHTFALVPGTGAITITDRSNGDQAGIVVTPAIGTASQTFVVTFSGNLIEYGSLRDGNYQLVVLAHNVTNLTGYKLDTNQDGLTGDDFSFGDASTDLFFRLFGDSNGDRDVDALDLLAFRRSLNVAPGTTGSASYFDERQDNDVDALDLLAFRRRLNVMFVF